MKKRALISVFVKDGVLELAQYLSGAGWEILSTGGTSSYLTKNGIPVTDVSSVTGFPECLDGRVKTLHPLIHAGLLARRDDASHMDTIKKLGVTPIDLVCVNLYPFFDKVQAGLSFNETVEFIDIGGPTMLRSAAKNFRDVLVLTDPADYTEVIASLSANIPNGEGSISTSISLDLKKRLAGKVFNLTSAYDAAVSRFMLEEELPHYYNLPLVKGQSLRYGENAHQQAALYLTADTKGAFGGMKQLQGKELSYNNIRDLDVAWKAVCAFNKHVKNAKPVDGISFANASNSVFTIALKHNTPCGASLGNSVYESYTKTYECDPVSIYGGIIGCSAVIDKEAAEEMKKCFLEVIVAPGFTDDALEVFNSKKNLRLIIAEINAENVWECTSVDGGLLVQNRDTLLFEKWEVVTKAQPTQAQIDEMAFGMTVALFAKSNAIVVVKDRAAIGIGCGQTNRIWAASQALERAKEVTDRTKISPAEVLISDAFFPFCDCVEEAAKYGIKAIIQPGGSVRDQESIDAADRLGIAMVFSGTRHFKH